MLTHSARSALIPSKAGTREWPVMLLSPTGSPVWEVLHSLRSNWTASFQLRNPQATCNMNTFISTSLPTARRDPNHTLLHPDAQWECGPERLTCKLSAWPLGPQFPRWLTGCCCYGFCPWRWQREAMHIGCMWASCWRTWKKGVVPHTAGRWERWHPASCLHQFRDGI